MTVATLIVDLSVQMAGQAAGGSQVLSIGVADSAIANLGAQSIFSKVVISSVTLNSMIQAAFISSGGSVT